jgi:hypothetical protein
MIYTCILWVRFPGTPDFSSQTWFERFEALFLILMLVSVLLYDLTAHTWPLGRPTRRWEDGIRMDLREIDLGGVNWIRLSQDRDRWRAVVSAVMNLRVLAPRS